MLKILVAEHDPAAGETLRRYLADQGHQVVVEDNPRLVFARMNKFQPHMTFVDINMADLNHLDPFSGLLDRRSASPTVFLVDLNRADHLRKLRSLDILSVLGKPFDFGRIDQLVQLVENKQKVRSELAA